MTQVTDDDLYRHTSQYRVWSFTKEELIRRRKEVYTQAAERVRKSLQEKEITEQQIDVISFEDEQKLVYFYASKALDVANAFGMTSQVKATALSYFFKFYLVHSVMDHHPKSILLTCVFLAAKAENHLIPINTFCETIPKTKPEDILGREFLVLESLSFTLMVLNGYRPLRGLFLDIQAVLPSTPSMTLGQLHDDAKDIIVQSFMSDAVFLFTPPQISMSALLMANETITMEYLHKKFDKDGLLGKEYRKKSNGVIDDKGVEDFDTLLKVLKECKHVIESKPSIPTSAESKEIDRRLYHSLNPEKMLNLSKRKLARSQSPSSQGTDGTSGNNNGNVTNFESEEIAAKRLKQE